MYQVYTHTRIWEKERQDGRRDSKAYRRRAHDQRVSAGPAKESESDGGVGEGRICWSKSCFCPSHRRSTDAIIITANSSASVSSCRRSFREGGGTYCVPIITLKLLIMCVQRIKTNRAATSSLLHCHFPIATPNTSYVDFICHMRKTDDDDVVVPAA